ncbi:hypothetical protein ACFU98_47695, partial [Streptomyces sp. NPDC057575]
KIERQQRQVTVDDLAALAVILGVSPSALLLPFTERPTDPVDVTGSGPVAAADAWQWAHGGRPLKLTPGKEQTELLEHQLYGLPQWLRDVLPLANEALRKPSQFQDARMRTLLEQATGMSVGEPQPIPEHRRPKGGDDGPSVD